MPWRSPASGGAWWLWRWRMDDTAHRAQIAALSGLLAGIAIGFVAGFAAALIFT